MGETVLEARGIHKRFPGVHALKGVSLAIARGEIHGLVGKNGAGKSTLISLIAGLQQPDEGTIAVGNEVTHGLTVARAMHLGIRVVLQEPQLVPTLSIAENVLSSALPRTRLGFVDWRAMRSRARELLARFELDLDVDAPADSLTVGQQQQLDIARALSSNASLIILDEPTAALNATEKATLFRFVRSLRGHATFIYISHYLDEVFELCDRVTVLRDGGVVATREIGALTAAGLTELIVGQGVTFVQSAGHARQEPALVVRRASSAGAFRDVDLAVRAGEIVGITGLAGSGKSELAQAIFGLRRLDAGTVEIGGVPARIAAPADALRLGLGYLPEDRRRYGLVPIFSVAANIALASTRRIIGPLGFLSARRERRLADEYRRALSIATPSLEQQVQFLSGGNQQKVVVSKLLAARPRVLLLDDPGRGVDVGAKAEIFAIVDRLSSEGMAIVISSDEVSELMTLADRILVMNDGRITHTFGRGEATQQQIVLAAEGSAGGKDAR